MTANLFNSAGNLYWYRHDGRADGTPRWTGRNEVGSGGWQNYTSTFGTGNFIYAIDPDGILYWYRHDGQSDGTPRWTGRKVVGEGGWQKYVSVFATGKYIYAIAPDGKLYWYRHDGQEDGTEQWTGRQEVGQGWQIYSSVFASGDIIYGIDYYVTYLSASMAPLVDHYPDDYANYLLPKVETLLGEKLVNEPHRSYFGTVMMDYPRTSVINLLISAALHHQ